MEETAFDGKGRGWNEAIFIQLLAFPLTVIHHLKWKHWEQKFKWGRQLARFLRRKEERLIKKTQNMQSWWVSASVQGWGGGSYPACQPQGDVTLLSSVCDLQLVVVEARAERSASLSQAHVHDALPFPRVLKQLWIWGGKAASREAHRVRIKSTVKAAQRNQFYLQNRALRIIFERQTWSFSVLNTKALSWS